jgi:hypothetical protein
MFPHEKQNLINYRFVLGWTAVLFVGCVVVGTVKHGYAGWAFAVMQGYAALNVGRGLFTWSPEPTAKRQFAAAIAVHVAVGAAGYLLVDRAIEWLLTRAPL